MTEPGNHLTDLLRTYRELLVQMDTQRVEHGGSPRAWNRLVNRMQAVQLQLRASQEGRDGITALITDENVTVRSWSAVNALPWAEPQARAELQRLAETDAGLRSLEAKTALQEFDAGRLDTAWTPKGVK